MSYEKKIAVMCQGIDCKERATTVIERVYKSFRINHDGSTGDEIDCWSDETIGSFCDDCIENGNF